MPAQTLFSTDLADWVLGSSASRGTSARRIPRLDCQRRAFGAIERLEARQVLSTAPVDPPAAPPVEDLPVVAELAAGVTQNVAWQSAEIKALLLRVNGQEVWVERSEGRVMLREGDALEVIGARLAASDELVATGGVLQLEGYVRMPYRRSELGEFDYGGGLFSAGSAVGDVGQNGDVQPGLDGSWKVGAGFNRMSVALVHYTGNEVTVVDRFFIHLQTDIPDFVLSAELSGGNDTPRVGQSVRFRGEWTNAGDGNVWTYAELDVYHESDLGNPVWVGTITGETGPGERERGTFENTADDAFERRWRPDRAGTYVVKAYVDPENAWQEPDEANNMVVFRVIVADSKNN